MKTFIGSLIFVFSSVAALASPHPATGSSLVTNAEEGHYFESQGFRLRTAGTNWLPTPQDKDAVFESVRMTPKGQLDAQSSFSVRTDSLSKQTTLESYAKKWMRDYPSYGFEVLGAKSFSMAGGPGLVVDMVQKNKAKQIRQVILQRGQRVAILTCLDAQATFQKTLVSCNQLVKNFEWTASGAAPAGGPEATRGVAPAVPAQVSSSAGAAGGAKPYHGARGSTGAVSAAIAVNPTAKRTTASTTSSNLANEINAQKLKNSAKPSAKEARSSTNSPAKATR